MRVYNKTEFSTRYPFAREALRLLNLFPLEQNIDGCESLLLPVLQPLIAVHFHSVERSNRLPATPTK